MPRTLGAGFRTGGGVLAPVVAPPSPGTQWRNIHGEDDPALSDYESLGEGSYGSAGDAFTVASKLSTSTPWKRPEPVTNEVSAMCGGESW